MIENLNKKQKIIIGIVILAVIVGIATYFIIKNNQYEEFDMNDFVKTDTEEYKGDTIIVHITGEVKEPGIKELPDEARIADQTTTNMIQRISHLFARKPLILKGI